MQAAGGDAHGGASRRKAAKAAKKEARRAARKQAKEEARRRRLGNRPFVQKGAAGLVRLVFAGARAIGRERSSRIASCITRRVGPFTRENRVATNNLKRAYPEKSRAERATILAGVWENLGRQTIEYAFLRELVDGYDPERPTQGPVITEGLEHAFALRDSGRAGVVFGAHLGNFEIPAMLGARIGMKFTGLYRPPTNPYIAADIERIRSDYYEQLIPSGQGAALKVAMAVARGKHLGVLLDQRISEGEPLPFFGRMSLSNPIVGWLARRFDCPVHGAYSLRLPDGRIKVVMTPPISLPRDASGQVDATGANIVVHGMIEQWIRAAPEQWFWLHDRWRYGRRKHERRF